MSVRSFAALVVVYNQSCQNSPTCRALANRKRVPPFPVLIYDNSTRDFQNRAYCEQQHWIYLGGTGTNAGLSKAYNAGISYCKEHSLASVICLFDDDTHLEESYFEELTQALLASDRKIFVPLIYTERSLISPGLLKPKYKIRGFQTEEEALHYTGNELTAINSCMAIDLSLFNDYRYDEAVFLDGIDHRFLSDMKQRGEAIQVFPYRCRHEFSGESIPPKEAALHRFSIFRKDFRYLFRNQKSIFWRVVGKRALKLTVQYRSLSFLKILFRENRSE